MKSQKVVVDTSVFIDYARSNKGLYLDVIRFARDFEAQLFVPTIVISEYWSGRSMNMKKEVKGAEVLFRNFQRIVLDEKIAKRAGGLVRDGRIHQSFDAIVAASALSIGAQLATGNKRHFGKVKGLRLFG